MTTFIDFHILQALPCNNINRDDAGSVKSVVVGGTTRTRISSQCTKRAVRAKLHDIGVETGIRSRCVATLLSDIFAETNPEIAEDARTQCAAVLAETLGADKAVTYLTPSELDDLAGVAVRVNFNPKKIPAEVAKLCTRITRETGGHSGLDVALFGRMIAKMKKNYDVEAAASFAHAYTTHTALGAIDFFTCVDDLDTSNAVGHIGINEFSSGVYYRFVSLNVDLLRSNLKCRDEEQLKEAIRDFLRALYLAVPTGRQTTMTAQRTWDYCHAVIHTGQPCQAVFDKPVQPKGRSGLLEPSIESLEEQIAHTRKLFGRFYGLKGDCIFGKEEKSIDDFADEVVALI